MKSTLSKFAVLSTMAAAMFFTSCGKKDTVDSLTDEIITKFDELAETVATAKDKESAEAAAKKIDAIGDDILAIAKRLEALPEPSEDEKKKIDEKMDAAVDDMQKKMADSMKGAMADPEVGKIIMEAMNGFGKKMDEAEDTFKKFGKSE